jgi:lipid A disaccharide synthetase
MDDPGYFDEPDFLRGKIHYVGSVLRDLKVSRTQRGLIRREFSLSENEPMILVLPSGSAMASEEKAPIYAVVSEAIEMIGRRVSTIWILSETEEKLLRNRTERIRDAIFIRPNPDIERLMVAADVAITRATRKTTLELSALGIPSISISFGINPIDDFRIPHVKTNRALRARGLNAHTLSMHISQILQSPPVLLSATPNHQNGRIAAVGFIRERIGLLGRIDISNYRIV